MKEHDCRTSELCDCNPCCLPGCIMKSGVHRATSYHLAFCGEYRRMTVSFQSGAVELGVSTLRMCLFRMGSLAGVVATAMKKKRCKYDDQ